MNTPVDQTDRDTVSSGEANSVLAIFHSLPTDPAKNAQMLVLERLIRLGWRVTVLTVSQSAPTTELDVWRGVRILRWTPRGWRWRIASRLDRLRRTRHHGLVRTWFSRLLLPFSTVLAFPDTKACANREIVDKALQLHREDPFAILLSLYSPVSSHLAAQRISKATAIPWVALTKDFYSWPDRLLKSRMNRVVNVLKRWYEPHTVRGAKLLLSTTDYYHDHQRKLLPEMPLGTLLHCYDENSFAEMSHFPEDGVFRLVSIGVVRNQDGFEDVEKLSVLFEVLDEMKRDGLDCGTFRLRVIGELPEFVYGIARQYNCEEFVDAVPRVSHQEAMQELVQANCLYYMQTVYGARRRLVEYMASRRPILAYPSYAGTLSERLLSDYGAALIAADKQALKTQLVQWYTRFRETGRLQLPVNEAVVCRHSASQRAEELAAILTPLIVQKHRDSEMLVGGGNIPGVLAGGS